MQDGIYQGEILCVAEAVLLIIVCFVPAAIVYLGYVLTACDNGASGVDTARSCVNSMSSGGVRTTCRNGL